MNHDQVIEILQRLRIPALQEHTQGFENAFEVWKEILVLLRLRDDDDELKELLDLLLSHLFKMQHAFDDILQNVRHEEGSLILARIRAENAAAQNQPAQNQPPAANQEVNVD